MSTPGQHVIHRIAQAGAITGFIASFSEGPIDFYKSQIQVQVIRQKSNPDYVCTSLTVVDCYYYYCITACIPRVYLDCYIHAQHKTHHVAPQRPTKT